MIWGYGEPTAPIPFVGKGIFFSSAELLLQLHKKADEHYLSESVSPFSAHFIDIWICPSTNTTPSLDSCSSVVSLKSSRLTPPTSFSVKFVLALLTPLRFRISSRIGLFIFTKKLAVVLIGTVFCLQIYIGRTAIFPLLSFSA